MTSKIAGDVASSAVSSGIAAFVSGVIFGSYNPSYNKEDRRRIRYIQLKYAQAYGGNESNEPNAVINTIDPNSKIKMNGDGVKPANPFPDERAFEEGISVYISLSHTTLYLLLDSVPHALQTHKRTHSASNELPPISWASGEVLCLPRHHEHRVHDPVPKRQKSGFMSLACCHQANRTITSTCFWRK